MKATLTDGCLATFLAPLTPYPDDARVIDLFDGASFGKEADADHELQHLYTRGDVFGFLREAVVRRKTIIVSGGTASGKSTLVNALPAEAPRHERIVAKHGALCHASSGSETAPRSGIGNP